METGGVRGRGVEEEEKEEEEEEEEEEELRPHKGRAGQLRDTNC